MLDVIAIMEAWARNLGYMGIEELLNAWPALRVTDRHMHVELQCVSCGRSLLETYRRQDPDFLAFWMSCHWCGQPVTAVRVIPFTIYPQFRSLGLNMGGGHCWQCGKALYKQEWYTFTLQYGLTIDLCRKHRVAYQRHIVRMADLAEVKRAALEGMTKQWYKQPGADLAPARDAGESFRGLFTLASSSEEASQRFARELAGENSPAEVATHADIEREKLYYWIF